MLNSKLNSILIKKLTLIQSQSQVHNHSMPMSYCNVSYCHCNILYTDLINNSLP